MQPDASKIRQLLKKTQHFDKDERFMATSDLTEELEKVEGQLDASLQTPIRDAIMKQLDDKSNDVQAQACNCLSAIVKKFNVDQIEEIVDKLGTLLINGEMELRDIYTIALKNIVTSVPDDFGPQISKKLVRRLIQGFAMRPRQGDTPEETQEHLANHLNRLIACLEITKDLSVRFGYVMSENHEEILNTIQPMLNHESHDIRKKVAVTLGATVSVVNDELFRGLMQYVIDQIRKIKRSDEKLFTYIQAIGVFSKNGGKRVSVYLPDVVPLLLDICSDTTLDEDPSEASIDLRENCLQAFDTLIVQCPKEISAYTDDLLNIVLRLMKFDPFYSYDEEMKDDDTKDADDDGFGGDDDGWGDDDDGGWGDDGGADVVAENADDTTWKIRRAALKMLASFIQTHKSRVLEHQMRLCDELLQQFREHDPTVKLELFTTFRELLLATIVADAGVATQHMNTLAIPSLARQRTDFHIIAEKLGDIMEQVSKQMKSGNAEVRGGLLGIVRDLVVIRQAQRSDRCDPLGPEGISQYFPQLIPEIVRCINDSDAPLKMKGLYVLYLILERHSEADCLLIIDDVKECAIESVLDEYSRVKAQALMAVGRILEIIRPFKDGDTAFDTKFEESVRKIYEVSFKQLALKDVEQEVKKAALDTIAIAIAHFGDLLAGEVSATLEVLYQRLNNEVTRQTALHAFATISKSPLKIDLEAFSNKLVVEMQGFLKKQSQSLKLDTATTLQALMTSCGPQIDPSLVAELIQQCADFIADTDLHLCHLILDLLCQILQVQPKSAENIAKFVFPRCFSFVESPLLQGHALEALKKLFRTFQNNTKGQVLAYDHLKAELIKAARPGLSRQSYSAISQCLSTLTSQVDERTQHMAVEELIGLIESKEENQAQVALLCIGEMGREKDLSSHTSIEQKIFGGFVRESESVKWAASYALGNTAVGNLQKFVPILLEMIQQKADRQYLLLNSLKEVISVHSVNEESRRAIHPYASSIVPLLLKNSDSTDEGVRAMVAECLGKFAIIDPEIYAQIEGLLNDGRETVRATMATSLKFALNKANRVLPRMTMEKFLELLDDKDLTVKRAAFLTVNTVLHVNHRQIVGDFEKILPVIYEGTKTNPDLIREVDLGPFKHRVDDGLPLRKAAFQCMDTLLDSASSRLELHDFLTFLRNGLTDESPDIQMLTYQILYRLGHFHGSAIISALDDLPDSLMKGIKGKMNDAKGTKDPERAKDILRAAVKALYTLRQIPNATKSRKYCNFYSRVEKTKFLLPLIAEMKKDNRRI